MGSNSLLKLAVTARVLRVLSGHRTASRGFL
jgi:hypothetical protein